MSDAEHDTVLPAPHLLDKLRCPVTGEVLVVRGRRLETPDRRHSYRISMHGVPLFGLTDAWSDACRQQQHYDRVAAAYVEHLDYPHTKVYLDYLDRMLIRELRGQNLGVMAEVCCGRGEALRLLGGQYTAGVGVDISEKMLEAAIRQGECTDCMFVQGDATRLPLASGGFDSVVMLGGIHHVNDRAGLFSEVARILRAGGSFYWREPVSDFVLWRMLRAVIYRLSPALDHQTERPLRFDETVPYLRSAGLELKVWKTFGYIGFCLFMNSDILIFNRLFRYLPGIRAITRAAVLFDDAVTRLPGMSCRGLQVIGVAQK